MTVERGRLVLSKKGRPLVEVEGKRFNVAEGEVSQTLLGRLTEFDGKEVEFERVGGQPTQVREAGAVFVSTAGDRTPSGAGNGRSSRPESSTPQQERLPLQRGGGQRQPRFHNPYNFVPAPPRNTADPDLGDHCPIPQDSFDPQGYTGRICVRMVARTPLLVPDTENAQEADDGHKTFALRLGADGKPSIASSSIRGMLRAAYETVTNSRFSRFSPELRDRLAFRMEPDEGLRVIPARVGDGEIRLLTGTSAVGADGRPRPGEPQYAAWLPRYRNGQADGNAVRYSNGGLPAHGDEVDCWIERFQHHRWDKRRMEHVRDFEYWVVRAAAPGAASLGPAPPPSNPRPRRNRESWHEGLGQQPIRAHGWVCVTNANINRKHDERVFFSAGGPNAPGPYPLTEAHRAMWQELIQNYQSIHEDDLRHRHRSEKAYDQYLGREPGQTAWSRHVYTDSDRELENGTLCYVRLNRHQDDVEAIFPVMIARELYPVSPWELLDESLRPAASMDKLSSADRVFGWVRSGRDEQGHAAVRGLLRVGPVTCTSAVADAVESFETPGVPLAILSAPKPQQGRFYVARTPNGEAQAGGLSKADAGYALGRGLRGRKVYPHQRSLPEGHWRNPTEDRTRRGGGSPAHYQEYRRPQRDGSEQRDDQNRSILAWVKPGAEFTLDLRFQNLSEVEVGALVWLLSLPDEHFLRFGGGKPLGFGSVRLALGVCDARTGPELRARYASWEAGAPAGDHREASVKAFQAAVVRSYAPGALFEEVPFIRAFLAACRGFQDSLPTHYPRATEDGQPGPPSPEGESFRWFDANEREDARHALPEMDADHGLPVLALPRMERRRGGGGR